MQIKKSVIEFKNLPDTITPEDYALWRGVGENMARATFNAKGFPRIPNTGVKLLADKRVVFLYEAGLSEKVIIDTLEKILKF